jgi:hypothetical protein
MGGVPFKPGNKVGRQFQKGQSGCPTGKPPIIAELRELARKHTKESVETLVEVMRDVKASATARVSAASHLLDRGWGRPQISVDCTGAGILQVITGILRAPDEPLVIEGDAQPIEPDGSVH